MPNPNEMPTAPPPPPYYAAYPTGPSQPPPPPPPGPNYPNQQQFQNPNLQTNVVIVQPQRWCPLSKSPVSMNWYFYLNYIFLYYY